MPVFLPLASDVSLYAEDTSKARTEPRRVSGIYAAPSGRQAVPFSSFSLFMHAFKSIQTLGRPWNHWSENRKV